jgi:hypothetical protein
MCGNAPARIPTSRPESQTCLVCAKAATGYTTLASAAGRLIAHLGLTRRLKAEVQDLYSSPTTPPAVAHGQKARESKRLSRPVSTEPDSEAA